MSGHQHDHPHEHGHRGLWARLRHAVGPHSHAHSHARDRAVDPVLASSAEGLRALWISLAGLAATALAQAVVVALSGSVALLGDALHNSADALTAVPLGFAFLLSRRRPTRRYTYGYGRAEDLAGIVIVAVIVRVRPERMPEPGPEPSVTVLVRVVMLVRMVVLAAAHGPSMTRKYRCSTSTSATRMQLHIRRSCGPADAGG